MTPISQSLAAVTVAAVVDPVPDWARRQLTGASDWPMIAAWADAESMLPLVHRARVRLYLTDIPPDIAHHAHASYRRTAALNLRRQNALAKTVSALTRHGLPVVVMQGASLWEAVYGDPGLRPVSDIDLWIPIRDGSGYTDVLTEIGFIQDPHYHDTFRNPDVTLDIHRHLLWADRIDARRHLIKAHTATVFDRTITPSGDGDSMRILSEFDQALYLTLHLAKHHFGALGWMADLLLLTHGWGLEKWRLFSQTALQWGRPSIAHLLGYVMQRFSGEALPMAMASPDPVCRWLVRQRLNHGRIHPWASAWVLPARLPLSDQWRYAWETVWPRQTVLEQIFADRLPASPRHLKLLRLGQLAIKAGRPFYGGKR